MDKIDSAAIKRAVDALRRGELVAFPTETVYGLGADARNRGAVERLYQVKRRPASHPVIVHLAQADRMREWADPLPEAAGWLAARFWPGPLTLVLPRAQGVPDIVTGGQDTIGLRVPSHPVAAALLREFGGGIAAPSANRFGRLSPTVAADVSAELGDDVAVVLEGGPCQVGIESTIVDLSGAELRILRPGMILPEEIEEELKRHGFSGGLVLSAEAVEPGQKVRAPGTLPSHYAPETPLRLVPPQDLRGAVSRLVDDGLKVAVLALGEPGELGGSVVWLMAEPSAAAYARGLYSHLRRLDSERCDCIVVEDVPAAEEWIGIRDRLRRAAAPRRAEGGENG